jgi:hypothetical protein
VHIYNPELKFSVNFVDTDHVLMWIQTLKYKGFNVMVLFVITQKTECFYTILKHVPLLLTNAARLQEEVKLF